MSASAIHSVAGDLAKQIASTLFEEIAEERKSRDFSVRFWDGSDLKLCAHPKFTIVIQNPSVLRSLMDSPNELALGESYIHGDLDIEGDLEEALRFAGLLMAHKPRTISQGLFGKLTGVLSKIAPTAQDAGLQGALHSRERDRAAIAYHYDISNDFYRLWLDDRMVYSEAYFESPEEDLDTAQIRKLDHICRKLCLRPGEKLLDIGCGWGGLVMHAASHYGADTCGITLSERQADLARERIRTAQLEDRSSVRICDYRDVNAPQSFDKIASIGMVEHVGEAKLPEYFAQAFHLLRPGGLFLVSGISASATQHRQGPSFMDRYVFPDGDLVPLYKTLEAAERCGFEVRDVEDLAEHYALTLDRWVQRLEQNAEAARQVTSDVAYRTWKLYMAASAQAFRSGRIGLYQTLFSKPANGQSELPLTRREWYDESSTPNRRFAA
jgi:cyclopropane-fatty-acyl-phospholipid synthase